MAGVGAQIEPTPERAGGDAETWRSERLPDSYLPKLQKSSCPPKWGLRVRRYYGLVAQEVARQDGIDPTFLGVAGAEQAIFPDQ